MAGRTPSWAFRNHVDSVDDALHCLTSRSFRTPAASGKSIVVGSEIAVALNDLGDPIPLRASLPVLFNAAQVIRIDEVEASDRRERFRAIVRRYFYGLWTVSRDGKPLEMLVFQWTPDARGSGAITFPHLHIGPALGGGQAMIRPEDVRKIHVPTGYVSLTDIVRLAIVELGAKPLRANWPSVLRRVQAFLGQDATSA